MYYLVFCPEFRGHHLEYIHHKYNYAGEMMNNVNFIFILNPILKNKLDLFTWNAYKNIKIDFFTTEEISFFNNDFKGLKKKYLLTKLLYKYYKDILPDKIILDVINNYMPFLSFFNFRKDSLRGIIYYIPFYDNIRNNIRKLYDWIILFLLAKSRVIEKIFILNDSYTSNYYNKKFNTNHFKFLPDPINIPESYNPEDKDEDIDLVENSRIKFLHPGCLGMRKGTDVILETIKNLNDEELASRLFIFIGTYEDSYIKIKFDEILENDRYTKSIILINDFVSYEKLMLYFKISDYVLLPYRGSSQSSGILGYSAFFEKPIIGTNDGLIGRLIKDFHLGYVMENIDPESLYELIKDIRNNKTSNNYKDTHTIDEFSKIYLS